MEITFQYFDGCPNWQTTYDRLDEVLADRDDVNLTMQRVETPEEAADVAFGGSPTILVDGVTVIGAYNSDLFDGGGINARIDMDENGLGGITGDSLTGSTSGGGIVAAARKPNAPALLAAATSSGVATQPIPVCRMGTRQPNRSQSSVCSAGDNPKRLLGDGGAFSPAPLARANLRGR